MVKISGILLCKEMVGRDVTIEDCKRFEGIETTIQGMNCRICDIVFDNGLIRGNYEVLG